MLQSMSGDSSLSPTVTASVMRPEEPPPMAMDNCSSCLNDLCIEPREYQVYEQAVSVDTYEMILIGVHILIFLCGILGNVLVSDQ